MFVLIPSGQYGINSGFSLLSRLVFIHHSGAEVFSAILAEWEASQSS